ncbi:Lethal(2) giant larvae sro7 [Coemansia erecta]|nr:Lethal(2) giant larvae sro7 [Coemansia erecta]
MLSLVEDRFVDATADATAIAFDPIQGTLAVGFATGQICLYTYNRTSAKYSISTTSINFLQFIPAKAVLAVIDDQGMLRVFDTHKMKYCFSYAVPSPPTCVSFIPGTSWLLIGTHSGRVYFVDLLEGRKSDFSIGCRVKPIGPAVTVEPHPMETEKILIGYASGTCVVCDIGKASVSEKDMVLSSYVFDSHPEEFGRCFRLACAGWSPAGDMIVSSFENGVFCIFNTGSGAEIAPVVARTIYHDSVLPDNKPYNQISAEDLDNSTACLGQVRWCTSTQSNRTFLVLTSGPSIVEQKMIHIFRTHGDVSVGSTKLKGSSDIYALEHLELKSPIIALCTMPAESPWKGGNDDVQVLLALIGCPATVQALELSEELRLAVTQRRLPGDMQWCQKPMAFTICQARGKIDKRICRLLDRSLVPLPSLLLKPHGYHRIANSCPEQLGLQQQQQQSSKISQVVCAADIGGIISLWCARDGAFSRCIGLGADLDRLSQLLGIRGKACAIDWYASNGLIVVSMDSGESLFFVVSQDSAVPLAKNKAFCKEISRLSAEYYKNPPPAPCDTSINNVYAGGPDHLAQRGSRVQSTQIGCAPSKRLSMNMRDRAASLNEGNFIRRSSKRLSASIGSVFRRGQTHDRAHGSDIRMASSHKHQSRFSRQMPVDADIWKRRLLATNKELSEKIYGLDLDANERQQVIFNIKQHGDKIPVPQCTRVDSGALACVEDGSSRISLDQQLPHDKEQLCVVAPFMMARFFYREIIDTVFGHDGIVAIIYKGGVVVVVDCVKQEVVLADNINQTPSEMHATASSIFSGAGGISKDALNTPSSLCQEITCASFVLMRPLREDQGYHQQHGREAGACSQQNSEPGLQEFLLVGTSAGLVLRYPVEGEADPPDIVASLDAFCPIVHLSAVDISECTWPLGIGQQTQSFSDRNSRFVIVGSSSAIYVLSDKSYEQVAKYDAAELHSNSTFVAAGVLQLDSGWQGVAAIDTKAAIALLSLPTLAKVKNVALASARGKIKSASDIQISKSGYITLLTSDGSLLQARICQSTDRGGGNSLEMANVDFSNQKNDACFFNASLHPPAQPLRKGITSWLFGRSSNAAPDIDAFLGASFRDLLRKGTDGERPSQAQPSSAQANVSEGQHRENAKEHPIYQQRREDSRRMPGDNIDMGAFSEMRGKAERRGQKLQEVQDSVDRAQVASENYLASIRAYNAKQEKKNKLFGLF